MTTLAKLDTYFQYYPVTYFCCLRVDRQTDTQTCTSQYFVIAKLETFRTVENDIITNCTCIWRSRCIINYSSWTNMCCCLRDTSLAVRTDGRTVTLPLHTVDARLKSTTVHTNLVKIACLVREICSQSDIQRHTDVYITILAVALSDESCYMSGLHCVCGAVYFWLVINQSLWLTPRYHTCYIRRRFGTPPSTIISNYFQNADAAPGKIWYFRLRYC